MPVIYDTIFNLMKLVTAYLVLFFIVPVLFIKFDEESNHFLDKLYISIIHSNFAVIIIIHLLVLLRIYESFSFMISYIAVIVLYVSIMNKQSRKASVDGINHANEAIVAKMLDFWESDLGFRGTLIKGTKSKLKSITASLKGAVINFIHNPIEILAVTFLLFLAAFVRFSHSVMHLYYGASDAYVHLAWSKYLGNNQIYRDGVYPYGYNALISALNKAFLIDPAIIIRFIGALGSMLIVLSIYYVLKRNYSKDKLIPVIGLALYVISTELPNNTWRQMSALPQEYAMLLLLPGMHYLNLYFKDFKKYYLILAAEVLALALFLHLYVGLFIAIGYVIICALNLKTFLDFKFTMRFGIIMGASGILGVLPMLVGLASGIELHRLSAQFVIESAGTQEVTGVSTGLFSYNEPVFALKVVLICSIVLLLISFFRMFFDRKPDNVKLTKLNILFAIMSIFLYLQFRATELGIPALMEFSRVGIFLAMIAVVAIALLLGLLDLFIKIRFINYILKIAIIIPIILTMYNNANFTIPEGARLEYDDAAYAYVKIKNDFPILNWTIISPVEQYQQSIGYGWHYNLWEFVSDVVEKNRDELKVPTDYIFIFVEKYPLNSTQKITEEDALEPFPDESASPDRYYIDYNNRRVIQAKAYYWAEENMKKRDYMQIYMDTEVLRVYMIKQDGTKPYDLAR